jgi:hypothetical protein
VNLSAEQIDLLHRAYCGDLYVYPESMTRPGGNIHSSDLVVLSERGLTLLGPRHDRGRRVDLTKRGSSLYQRLLTTCPWTERTS